MPQDKQSQKEIKKTKILHKYFCTSFSLWNLSFSPSFSHILPKLSFLVVHIYLYSGKNPITIQVNEKEELSFCSSASPIYKERGRNTFSQKHVKDDFLPSVSLKHWVFQATDQNPNAPKSV